MSRRLDSDGSGRVALARWDHLTAPEALDAAEADPVLVLPLAATEQHGPHLPLSTDVDIGLGILARAAVELPSGVPAYLLPPLVIGASEEHTGFAGTLSLSADVVAGTIVQIGEALARSGVRRLVLANSHGGNVGAMEDAALALRVEEKMVVVKASWFRFPRPATAGMPGGEAVPGGETIPEKEWRHGLHAGRVETSMMLHLCPDLVRTELMGDHSSLGGELEENFDWVGPQGVAPFAWIAEDLNESGAVGNAALATAEEGRALVDHYGRVMAGVIEEAARFPLERLG